jgi:prepilin-type N-terminal cleavage/methylation domain-containing protein
VPATEHMRTRRGFALLELIAAMAIAAVLMVGARVLLLQASIDLRRVGLEVFETDSAAVAERALRLAVGRLDHVAARMTGTPERAAFASWCDNEFGDIEPCDVEIAIVDAGPSLRVVMRSEGMPHDVTVRTDLGNARFIYRVPPEYGSAWLNDWVNAHAPARAIGLIMGTDALVVDVRERG